jgi:hypothetical protein
MIQVSCHTNLDLRGERWPSMLPCMPCVGDEIESATAHRQSNGNYFRLQLKVCAIRWEYNSDGIWSPVIELHMTQFQHGLPCSNGCEVSRGSIQAFYEWYAPSVGKSVGSFI